MAGIQGGRHGKLTSSARNLLPVVMTSAAVPACCAAEVSTVAPAEAALLICWPPAALTSNHALYMPYNIQASMMVRLRMPRASGGWILYEQAGSDKKCLEISGRVH